MAKDSVKELKERIRELELEVLEREKDISTFRSELSQANKKLEGLIAQINQELRVVYSIQKILVPTEIPNIPGFEFSSKFIPSHIRGGDYFDIFEHEDRSKFGIIVASCSGHVMSALLLSVLLKITGQMEARRGAEPHVIVKKIATELLGEIGESDSADIFYGVFDRRTFSLNYCRLGQVMGVMHDYSTKELKILKASGPTLAKGIDLELQTYSEPLNPRDRLIFCTRGVEESRNTEGQEYGQERLLRSILEGSPKGVHELRMQILYHVNRFSSGQEPPRDMTVVVSEVKDRVIKLAQS